MMSSRRQNQGLYTCGVEISRSGLLVHLLAAPGEWAFGIIIAPGKSPLYKGVADRLPARASAFL